jgi:ubiquinone/menaquinone biosynthesis C-methylase UbiE
VSHDEVEHDEVEEVRDFWNGVADDWLIQVGDAGDRNRRLNSDPVLWRFAGEVQGLEVLDAGCGTGYLSGNLHQHGARVTGIDLSEKMIEIARRQHPEIGFQVDSCSELSTVANHHFDLVVSNYVLMDTPDLPQTMAAFNRVLKLNGVAVLVFSHPCFPQGRATMFETGDGIRYDWRSSYFDTAKCVDPPWGHFTSDFIWFHRPLSDYWKAFTTAGFGVVEFEEPRITADRYHLAMTERELMNGKTRPCSVAFKLQKTRQLSSA